MTRQLDYYAFKIFRQFTNDKTFMNLYYVEVPMPKNANSNLYFICAQFLLRALAVNAVNCYDKEEK